MIGKRPRGRKRLGMLNEFLKESSYAELKRKVENRKEWRIWKPRTCLTAEHYDRRSNNKKFIHEPVNPLNTPLEEAHQQFMYEDCQFLRQHLKKVFCRKGWMTKRVEVCSRRPEIDDQSFRVVFMLGNYKLFSQLSYSFC